MKTELYTIPHTGTRFVSKLLRQHSIPFNQRHVASPRTVPAWRRIITVRHPYDAYRTFRKRQPSNPDIHFVALWGHYLWRTQWMDAFYVPLDIDKDYRRLMLQRLVEFCGETPDFSIIDPYVEKWEMVGSVGEKDEFPEHMIAPLQFANEWYVYYTENWGARFRDSQNMNSEGT